MISYLPSIIKQFEYYKNLGEKTFDQLSFEELQWQNDISNNNISIIVKHMVGNMRSRWTNFLSEDGEKTWRKRDQEFLDSYPTKSQLLNEWDQGWICVLDVLKSLTSHDLERIVYIRNQGHTVTEAINRQLAHYAYHVGQIVSIGKHVRGADWLSLSISKGASQTYNQEKFRKEKGRRHFTDDLKSS